MPLVLALILAVQCDRVASAMFSGHKATNVVFVLADDMGWAGAGYQATPHRQHQPGAGGSFWLPNPPFTPHLDAMSKSQHSYVFDRFYAGSAVCSPTRSSVLSGRTPNRECITGAEGCGQQPAWLCAENLPFPPTTFTVAEAAQKANMSTLFVGKWHLGNFFPKPGLTKRNFVNKKWPVSHPGMHGFDEWHATEASASSSMCNCGCHPEWIAEGHGCVIGGGKFVHDSFACTNYWRQLPEDETQPLPCRTPQSTRECVANLTSKIPGDDSMFILDRFEAFLDKRDKRQPFLALLHLHTVHQPHPAMPQYYYAYNDTYGDPAGDYLGTLTQMDAAIGRLRGLLAHLPNTMLWFTADNGVSPRAGMTQGIKDVRSATNGLRQCKASLFEGGIRVPGIIEWPAVIMEQQNISIPVSTNDFLPTMLDLWQVEHEHPSWRKDGESILSLLSMQPPGVRNWSRTVPLGFNLDNQTAFIDPSGQYKALLNPAAGLCRMEAHPNYQINGSGVLVFDLIADPTESTPISKDKQVVKWLTEQMLSWKATIVESAVNESQCMESLQQ